MTIAWSNPHLPPLQWAAVLAVSLAAAVWDVKSGRIPNALTAPAAVAGILTSAMSAGLSGLGDSLAGCVAAALPLVLLFVIGVGGAGDAKLMGAVGAWLGLWWGVAALVCVVICGGVMGVGVAVARGRCGAVRRNFAGIAAAWMAAGMGGGNWSNARQLSPAPESMEPMPYGVAIFCGCGAAAIGAWLCPG